MPILSDIFRNAKEGRAQINYLGWTMKGQPFISKESEQLSHPSQSWGSTDGHQW